MNHKLVKDTVMVELHDETSEGWNGDYDPNDPGDDLLLRFDVSQLVNNQWESVDNGSYCTRLPATLEKQKVEKALQAIMREVYDPVTSGYSIKKTCEVLSWIHPNDL